MYQALSPSSGDTCETVKPKIAKVLQRYLWINILINNNLRKLFLYVNI